MIILAVYYLLADVVLLGQCFYYRGFTWHDEVIAPHANNERQALLHHPDTANEDAHRPSIHHSWSDVDVTHLSPATPLMPPPDKDVAPEDLPPRRVHSWAKTIAFNSFAIMMVVVAGVFGWWVSNRSQRGSQQHDKRPVHHSNEDGLQLSFWGQVFGYGCAFLYLGSRLPQILLNYRRKSTEGLSGLFFLFACLGNVTYFLSIFAYDPLCHGSVGKNGRPSCEDGEAAAIYGRYMLVNASWLLGSIGCLFLDFTILLQFFLYRPLDDDEFDAAAAAEQEREGRREDDRPLLSRVDSCP